jgi:hypothetical protein
MKILESITLGWLLGAAITTTALSFIVPNLMEYAISIMVIGFLYLGIKLDKILKQ